MAVSQDIPIPSKNASIFCLPFGFTPLTEVRRARRYTVLHSRNYYDPRLLRVTNRHSGYDPRLLRMTRRRGRVPSTCLRTAVPKTTCRF